ncbi:hypothetical protein [uncultured Salipiger sp.]|uniref:hypothetical protein n=1 Tax=uncultured Salipiger sp. TaxID=499810 RepID=UPI00259629E8|nr:hypothetical protein [uncultured Salipiger sp.]
MTMERSDHHSGVAPAPAGATGGANEGARPDTDGATPDDISGGRNPGQMTEGEH